jgi:predicted Zn-dependent protease
MLENSVGQHMKMSYVEFLLDCGDTEAASRMLAALDRDEGGPRMAVAEARVKAMSGDVDAAMELVASVSKEERDPDIQKAMGEIFESAGDLRSARACFEEALSRRPSDFSVALSLTRVFERMGEHRAAIRAADVAIGIDDAEWEPYDLKARAYAALGESGKSEAAKAMASERLSGSGQTADESAGGVKG